MFAKPIVLMSKCALWFPQSPPMKYRTHFYDRQSGGEAACFASPSQEFRSGEAREFAQHAAEAVKIATTYSFRIESEDGKINELWVRSPRGWKLTA
jgi:hypothetical protein